MVPECVWVPASEGVGSWAGEDLGSDGFPPSREPEPPGGLLSSWLGTRLTRAAIAANSVPGLGAAAGVGP